MKIKTLPAAVVFSLAAHGLALALVMMVNGNGTRPGQVQERVPFIQASLVYAMNGHQERKASMLPPDKKNRMVRTVPVAAEPRPPDGVVTDNQVPEKDRDKHAQTGQAAGNDTPVSLHLPAVNGNGGNQVASIGMAPQNRSGDGIAGGAVRQNEETVLPPRYRHAARPAYPLTARLRGYEGVVLLAVEVLADGRPGRIGIKKSSGYALLDKSALDAVRAWQFEPARAMDIPQAMTVDIPVRFALHEAE